MLAALHNRRQQLVDKSAERRVKLQALEMDQEEFINRARASIRQFADENAACQLRIRDVEAKITDLDNRILLLADPESEDEGSSLGSDQESVEDATMDAFFDEARQPQRHTVADRVDAIVASYDPLLDGKWRPASDVSASTRRKARRGLRTATSAPPAPVVTKVEVPPTQCCSPASAPAVPSGPVAVPLLQGPPSEASSAAIPEGEASVSGPVRRSRSRAARVGPALVVQPPTRAGLQNRFEALEALELEMRGAAQLSCSVPPAASADLERLSVGSLGDLNDVLPPDLGLGWG